MTTQPIDAVRRARDELVDRQRAVDDARQDLYRAVAAASESGLPPRVVAEAAGWRTRKAVYDAALKIRGGAA